MPPITASLLYALVECPHRVWLDAVEDPAKRDRVSPFVELLWERGSKFERQTIQGLNLPFVDLSSLPPAEKERETLAAMQRGESLIYSGRRQERSAGYIRRSDERPHCRAQRAD